MKGFCMSPKKWPPCTHSQPLKVQGGFVLRWVTALPPSLGLQLWSEPYAGLWVPSWGRDKDSTSTAPNAGCRGPSASLFGIWAQLWKFLIDLTAQCICHTTAATLCSHCLSPLSGPTSARQCCSSHHQDCSFNFLANSECL